METTQITKEIRRYLSMSQHWNNLCNSIHAPEAFVASIIDLEMNILTYFGLPPSAYQYSSVMEKYASAGGDTGNNADQLYRWLKNTATDYLLSPAKSDKETLLNAKKNFLYAQEVLPFIGHSVTEFSRFLLHDVYYNGGCNETQLLRLLREEDKVYPLSDTISASIIRQEYLEYLDYKKTCIETQLIIETVCEGFDLLYPIDSILQLQDFLVIGYCISDAKVCVVDIAVEFLSHFIALKIWCTSKQLQYILLHARYASDTAGAILRLRNYKNGDETVFMNFNCGIEILGLQVGFERVGQREVQTDQPYSFVISELANYNSWLHTA